MLSEASYNNLMENLFVRSNKMNYVRLMESVQQLKKGKVSERESLWMMKVFTDNAWEDYLYWQSTDKSITIDSLLD